MNSFRFLSAFSFGPNCLHYCGRREDKERLRKCLAGKKVTEGEMGEAFSHFRGLSPFLELIAGANGKGKFDYEVCEAYWIGNALLEKVPQSAFREMVMEKFVGEDRLSREQAMAYAKKVSGNAFPHHSFHVMTVLSLTGKPEPTIGNIDSCRIGWGKIIAEMGESLTVEYRPITFGKKGFGFGERTEKGVSNPSFGSARLADASEGETIAFHWGFACKALDRREESSIEHYTKNTMNELNAQGFKLPENHMGILG